MACCCGLVSYLITCKMGSINHASFVGCLCLWRVFAWQNAGYPERSGRPTNKTTNKNQNHQYGLPTLHAEALPTVGV